MSAPSNSLQQPRVRRSTAGSPASSNSCRLHPIRAIVPYQLLSGGRNSPTRTQSLSVGGNSGSTNACVSSPASPILNSGANAKQRFSPENKDSCSPESTVGRADRSKIQGRSSSAILRTSSLDAITGPYLTGQWPRDTQGPYSSCMKDKATQTPGLWIDESPDQGSPQQRSASWGSADHLKEIAKLRLQLQRSKQVGRQGKEKEHGFLQQSQQTQYNNASQHQSKAIPSGALTASMPKCVIFRVPSYVEGINHELENVFIREGWEQSLQAMDVLDGRRAPFPPHRHGNGGDTRDTDTQAPSSSDSSPSPRPCCPDCLHSTEGSPCSAEETDKDLPKFATSPKPNNSYMFKREPPEGCERVKVFEEMVSGSSKGFPLFSCPDRNKVNFIPRGSAFCPVKLLCSSLFSSVSPSSSTYAERGFHGGGGRGRAPPPAPCQPAAPSAAPHALPAAAAADRSKDTDAGARPNSGADGVRVEEAGTRSDTSPDVGKDGPANALLSS